MAGRLLLRSEPGWYRASVAGLLAGLTLVVGWNAYSLKDWRLPGKEVRGYYNPPLFYVLAGASNRFGEDVLGIAPAEKLTQGWNALLLIAAAALLLYAARLVVPRRRTLHVAALGFLTVHPCPRRVSHEPRLWGDE